MFKLLARVQEMERQGKDIVHFEIGDPDFNTPEHIVEAACKALHKGETHYTSSMGLEDFREAARQTTARSRGFLPSLDQVLITPGANIAIYYAIRCLVDPGEEVIVPDPGFPTYYSAIKFCGVKEVRVPIREENAFRMTPEDIEQRITDKTRLIIINSPQNPTGSVMTPAEIAKVAGIAEKYDVADHVFVCYSVHPEGGDRGHPGRPEADLFDDGGIPREKGPAGKGPQFTPGRKLFGAGRSFLCFSEHQRNKYDERGIRRLLSGGGRGSPAPRNKLWRARAGLCSVVLCEQPGEHSKGHRKNG
jgi:hypothetical protein